MVYGNRNLLQPGRPCFCPRAHIASCSGSKGHIALCLGKKWIVILFIGHATRFKIAVEILIAAWVGDFVLHHRKHWLDDLRNVSLIHADKPRLYHRKLTVYDEMKRLADVTELKIIRNNRPVCVVYMIYPAHCTLGCNQLQAGHHGTKILNESLRCCGGRAVIVEELSNIMHLVECERLVQQMTLIQQYVQLQQGRLVLFC